MSRFFVLFEQWELAESAARGAERRLSQALDRYCERNGRAPSLQQISTARGLRSAAQAAFRALQEELSHQRQALDLV